MLRTEQNAKQKLLFHALQSREILLSHYANITMRSSMRLVKCKQLKTVEREAADAEDKANAEREAAD